MHNKAGDMELLMVSPVHRPTIILGSGPSARPPSNPQGWALFTVNGSQALATGWGLGDPDVTLFGTTVLGMRASNREAQRVLRGRRTRLLVMVSDGSNPLVHRFNLWRTGYHCDRSLMLTTRQRAEIFGAVLGKTLDPALKPSNGVFLALIALYLGAPEIMMTGFSLSSAGHGYNTANHTRHHKEADAAVLGEMARLALPVSTNDLRFSHESGLALRAAP